MRYRFIQKHKNEYSVRLLCRVLKVSPAGFYAWFRRPKSKRERANEQLLAKIRVFHAESQGIYGVPRVYRDLRAQGLRCGKNRVARLMRAHGIRSKMARKRYKVVTTDSKHDYTLAANILNRNFKAEGPNQKWVADITFIRTREGWLYLAVVLDLYSRAVVGWAVSSDMRVRLTASALQMAVSRRRMSPGLVHHSDRGVQYAAEDYQQLLKQHGMVPSMSRKGDCYDNAVVESFFHTLKTELVYHCKYRTREEARKSISEYIEVFYNRKRRHSSIGYMAPLEFENLVSAA